MIYQFTWKAIHSGCETCVQTTDEKMMRMFLQQHGFDPDLSRVEMLDWDDDSIDANFQLDLFKFGSRKRDRFYTIASSEEIIMSVIEQVSFDLMETMSLGTCALQCEFEVFDHITSLIEKLDFVYIRELSVNLRSDDDIRDNHYRSMYDNYPYYPTYEEASRDDERDDLVAELYQACMEYHNPDIEMPFTIETYLSVFTREYLLGDEMK